MTVTASISSQSVGTSTNVGDKKFPQKVTIQSGTTAFRLSARLTNGSASYDENNEIQIYYGTSPFDVTAAVAAASLKPVGSFSVRPQNYAAGVRQATSDVETVGGSYIYFWCNVPNYPVAATLDVSCAELP